MPDTYTTVQGDTWDKIAYDLYGDEAYMRYLIEANWEFLDLLVFPSGIVLNLPEIPDEPDEDWPEWRLDDDEDEAKNSMKSIQMKMKKTERRR